MTIKPAKTFEQQVDILINEHGLIVEDRDKAIETLHRINYYHLRGYYIHWMDKEQKRFNPGITFDMICSLQQFDMELRCLLIQYLHKIELSVRAAVAYYIANTYDPMAHLKPSIYENKEYFKQFRKKVKKEITNSSEIFIDHYGHNIKSTPVWACVEILPFGSLSFMYKNLNRQDRQEIAKSFYNIDEALMTSYLNSLPYLRNVCSHCGRLYAKWLSSSIRIKADTNSVVKKYYGNKFFVRSNLLFAYILAMRDLLTKADWASMTVELDSLFEKYKNIIEIVRLGFPYKWKMIFNDME